MMFLSTQVIIDMRISCILFPPQKLCIVCVIAINPALIRQMETRFTHNLYNSL